MNEISYFDAWHCWLNGENVSNFYLWGFKILWWGRIGKLVSFISALAVVAELIGPERLRKFGESLHGRFTRKGAVQIIKSGFRPLLLMSRTYANKNQSEVGELTDEFHKTRLGSTSTILAVVLNLYLAYVAYKAYGIWPIIFCGFVSLMLSIVLIMPSVIALVVMVVMAILLSIDILVIEPIAWLLDREALDKAIKGTSVLLLVIGFHFDLLAS